MSIEPILPDYDELDRALRALDAVGAAEAHGTIAGLLSGPHASADAMAATLFADVDPQADRRELDRLLGDLSAITGTQLAERESAFVPLLPGEERALDERVAALADFCRGYILGLLTAGVRDFAGLPQDAREAMQDFVEIAEAETGDLAAEDGEQALAELIEYVRVGVQLVYEDIRPVS